MYRVSGRGEQKTVQSRERRRGRVALLKPARSARRLAGRGSEHQKVPPGPSQITRLCAVCDDVVDSRPKAGTWLLKPCVPSLSASPPPSPSSFPTRATPSHPCGFKLSHAPDGWRVRVCERWMNGLVMDDDVDDKPCATRRLAWPGWLAWLAWRTRTRRANQGAALQCDRGKSCLKRRPRIAPQSTRKDEEGRW